MNRQILRFINKKLGSAAIFTVFAVGKIKTVIVQSAFREENPVIAFNNILVIKIVGMGDTVLMLPGIKKLKAMYPQAKISALVTPLSRGIFSDQHLFDEVIVYDIFGKQNGLAGLLKILSGLRKKKFDLIIDYEQHIKLVTILSYFTSAEKIIGFDNDKLKRGYLLTDSVLLDGRKHMFEAFNDLLKPLGIDLKTDRLERIEVLDDDKRYINDWMERQKIYKGDLLAGIHIGAGGRAISRRWSSEKFAKIGDGLSERYGMKIVLTGSAEEIPLIKDMAHLMKSSPVIAADRISIGQLVPLIDRCDLFISNDTGPVHIAAAMQTRTVALYGPESPERYRPFGPGHVTIYKKTHCSPCINIHNGKSPVCKRPECMDIITVDDVWAAVEDIIGKTKTGTRRNNLPTGSPIPKINS